MSSIAPKHSLIQSIISQTRTCFCLHISSCQATYWVGLLRFKMLRICCFRLSITSEVKETKMQNRVCWLHVIQVKKWKKNSGNRVTGWSSESKNIGRDVPKLLTISFKSWNIKRNTWKFDRSQDIKWLKIYCKTQLMSSTRC